MSMQPHSSRFVVAASAAMLIGASIAEAAPPTLAGHWVQLDWRTPQANTLYLGNTTQFIVGPGTEVPSFLGGYVSFDVTQSSIDMTVLLGPNKFTGPEDISSLTFNGFALLDSLGTMPSIASVSVNPATSLAGFAASRVSFDADHVYANLMSLHYKPGDKVVLDVTLVPEPSTWALWVLGLIGLAGWHQRRLATVRRVP